jgi:asparagine synthase (glutamine-hydrolysing)
MAVSLEVRPPLLDHVLIEQLFALPGEMRMQDGTLKYLLKEAAHDMLPDDILNRPKKGFGAPWPAWMRDKPQWVEETLRLDALGGMLREDIATMRPLTFWQQWMLLLVQQWLEHEGQRFTTSTSASGQGDTTTAMLQGKKG